MLATAFKSILDAVVKLRFESYSPQRLVELRNQTGLTQDQFCIQAGIPLATLKKWELGQRTPNLEGLSKLGKFFGIYFFAEWDEDEKNPAEAGP